MITVQDNDTPRPTLNFRDGASILAIGVLVPLAITGGVILASWLAVTLLTGQDFPTGTDLGASKTAGLLVLTRVIVMACWWIWLARRFGLSIGEALLAALPVVGIIWSLRLASVIVHRPAGEFSAADPRRVGPVLVGVVIASLLLLPIGIANASATVDRERERVAAPCLAPAEPVEADDPVAAVGDVQIGRGALDSYVAEVVDEQVGPVAKRDARWPGRVVEQVVWLELWEQFARAKGVSATVGDAEAVIEDQGGRDAFIADMALYGVPASTVDRIACEFVFRADLEDKVKPRSGESPEDAVTREVGSFSSGKVTLADEFGYWDPRLPGVSATKPVDDAVKPVVTPTYSARVQYEGDAIPDQEFPDTLDWNADLCVGAKELLNPTFLGRVALYERVDGSWRKVDAEAKAEQGGRCQGSQVNVIIGTTAPEPASNWTDKGWTTCRRYEVRLPEMPAFRATSVGLCVSTQATTKGESA